MPDATFDQVLTAALDNVEERGFLSIEQVQEWERRLEESLRRTFTPEVVMKEMVDRGLVKLYEKMVEKRGILRYHPGVPSFTLERIKPYLRAELDKRVAVSLNLVRLNKEAVVYKMKQRFGGWASSVPAGGSEHVQRKETREGIKKGIVGLKYEERRVLTDQGHKLVSSINSVLATQANAIAVIWRSHANQIGYDFRPDHRDRETESLKKPYLIKDSWVLKEGYVVKNGVKFIEDMTQPAEEPFCRCIAQYIYNLRQLPKDMLTKKGEEFLENAARKRAIYA